VQVVAFDDLGGRLAAARLWWMLRWLGHERVAVLDGGWQAWLSARGNTAAGEAELSRRSVVEFVPVLQPDRLVDTAEVSKRIGDPSWILLDARELERYRGEKEPIDPVAGHIPGAVSAPCASNLDDEGRFQPLQQLRDLYGSLVENHPEIACYCGSGVTACHDALALEHAGLGIARVYAGSWSQWIRLGGAVEDNLT
jgi:thiosulfate/3-mercaptopyruvate sulfurtransferase